MRALGCSLGLGLLCRFVLIYLPVRSLQLTGCCFLCKPQFLNICSWLCTVCIMFMPIVCAFPCLALGHRFLPSPWFLCLRRWVCRSHSFDLFAVLLVSFLLSCSLSLCTWLLRECFVLPFVSISLYIACLATCGVSCLWQIENQCFFPLNRTRPFLCGTLPLVLPLAISHLAHRRALLPLAVEYCT